MVNELIVNTAKIIKNFKITRSEKDGVIETTTQPEELATEIFNQPSGLPCPSTSCDNGLNIQYDGGTNPDDKCQLCNGTGKRTVLQALELVEKGEKE